MSNTRIGNDPCRIITNNEQSTNPGRWVVDVPGPGKNLPYMMDPQILAQNWAGNTWSNAVELQDKVMRGRESTPRDCISKSNYINKHYVNVELNEKVPNGSAPIQSTSSRSLTTEQSRAICPAWTTRGIDSKMWINPLTPSIRSNPFTPTVDCRDMSKKEWENKNN